MGKPIRIQRKRTKGWKMPPNTVYVGRPTIWGNPHKIGSFFAFNNKDAVDLFEARLLDENMLGYPTISSIREELKGKNLACWCPLNKPCHADILLKIANSK